MDEPSRPTLATLIEEHRAIQAAHHRTWNDLRVSALRLRRAFDAVGGNVEHDGSLWLVDDEGELQSMPIPKWTHAAGVEIGEGEASPR